MRKQILLACAFATLVCCEISAAFGQSPSTDIPLKYVTDSNGEFRLSINIGINGGAPRPYLFDTGSTLFNAVYDPQTWNGFAGLGPSSTVSPSTTVANGSGIEVCYSGSSRKDCRGYTGNIVQVPTLSFYAPGATQASATPAAVFTASQGFQINAAYRYTIDSTVDTFPAYFADPATASTPPQEGLFYGVFGSRISVDELNKGVCSGSDCYIAGGVLGQTIIQGATRQGFVVAANGQANPANKDAAYGSNSPTGNSKITIGGQKQEVASCNPCVTVGLTPQLIGQFAPVALPTPNAAPGLVQWIPPTESTPAPPFPNPYGSGTGNNSAPTNGTMFTVTVIRPDGSSKTVPVSGLLDTGTRFFALDSGYPDIAKGTVTVVGATPTNGSIPGLPTSISTLTGGPAYTIEGKNSGNTIGIPFFMQNSVMFDLSDRVTGYTPFFVTDANLSTTANGPLVVSGANVPLGLAGAISGLGGVTIENGGAVQLSATNSYIGPTFIAGASSGNAQGMLYISGPGSIAASSGVVNNGLFDISRAWAPVSIATLSGTGWVSLGGQNLTITNGSDTFSGVIGETGLPEWGSYPASGGSVTVAGGMQTFAGVNIYTGGTTVNGGALIIANTGSIVGNVTVNTGGGVTNNGMIGGNGLLTVNTGGTFINNGTIDTPLQWQLNQGSFINTGSFNGSLANTGTATNTGTLTGAVINGRSGTFGNNGTIGGNFSNMGVLSGNGTIGGDLANAGVLSPGNSIGSINVAGKFTSGAGSTYLAEVTSQGQSDRISIAGTANLQGGKVAVVALPGQLFAPTTRYTVLSAGGGVNGTFAEVSSTPFLQPSLSYDTNNIYLTLQIGGFRNVAQNPVQQAVGGVLDSTAPGAAGDYALVLGTLAGLTTSQVRPILSSLSGANYAGFSSSMVQGAQLFMNNFAGRAGGSGSPAANRVALAEACDVACDVTSSPSWGAWGGAVGGLGTIGAGASQGAVTYNAGGFAAGLDRAFTDSFRAGVTVGYSAGTQWVSGFNGQGNTDIVQFGLYGNYADGPLYADALFGYAYSSNRMTRQLVIPGLQPRTAWGQAGANQFFGQLETGYRFEIGASADASVTPFARLQAYTGTQNGFTETGAQSLDLSVAQQTTNSLRSVIGAQFGGSIDMGWREKLAIQLRLGWSHEYADVSRPVTAALAGAPATPFTTFGVSPARDGVLLGFGASTAIAEATSLYLRYEGTVAGQDSSHGLTAGVRMTW